MRRRVDNPGTFNIWPAFTDALGGLVVVLIFLITVFVIGEVLLGREMTGKDTAIGQLQRIIEHLEILAGDAQTEAEQLKTRVAGLEGELGDRQRLLEQVRAELAAAAAERERLRVSLDEAGGRARELGARLGERERELSRLREELGASRAERDTLQTQLEASRAEGERLRGELEGSQAEAVRLRAELGAVEAERQRLDSAYDTLRSAKMSGDERISELEAQAALLSARAERLAAELERLNRALLGKDAELTKTGAERELQQRLLEEQQSRIEQLDALLKRRLLERVEELEQYASDFFGRLRQVFAGNPNIKVEGDRFVFQSEVLFPSGEAALSPAGQADLDKFVAVYRQLAERLPQDLPVIIQVLGHTDRVPVRGGRFASNWELSHARAQAVVDYLIGQGIPAERLAAVAMGEYHPVDPADNPDAYRRNRRIELKITSR
ncbi:MAG TPA: OmpA family protein [Candidatus Competibacteraceae bacterium]|nr:OmpA family protein [Candidatus Competibacteraceae bacterium]